MNHILPTTKLTIEPLLTYKDVSIILHRSIRSLQRDVKEKRIPHIKFPSHALKFKLSSVQQYIERHEIRADIKKGE